MKSTDLDWSMPMSSLIQIPYLSLSTLILFPQISLKNMELFHKNVKLHLDNLCLTSPTILCWFKKKKVFSPYLPSPPPFFFFNMYCNTFKKKITLSNNTYRHTTDYKNIAQECQWAQSHNMRENAKFSLKHYGNILIFFLLKILQFHFISKLYKMAMAVYKKSLCLENM